MERGERLVAFIDLRHGVFARALPHGPHARAVCIPANDLRAVDDERIKPAFHKDMSKNGSDGGLATRSCHGHELARGKQFGKRRRTVDHGDTARARSREVGVRVLDGR